MTSEQINIAIAESLGWKYLENIITPSRSFNGAQSMGDCWQRPDGDRGYGDYEPPNYTADLNAMHEVELGLTTQKFETFWVKLASMYIEEARYAVSATALQRAEAYLRTIGKWKD